MDTIRTDYSLQIDQNILQKHIKQKYTDFIRTAREQRLVRQRAMSQNARNIRTPKTIE